LFLGEIEEKKLYFSPEIWRDKLPLAKFLEVWELDGSTNSHWMEAPIVL
jgi:hypothetical protein